MPIRTRDLDQETQLRFVTNEHSRVFQPPTDIDSIMTAQALNSAAFTFDGPMAAKPGASSAAVAGQPADLAFPINPTLTWSSNEPADVLFRGYNQLGEYVEFVFNKGPAGTTSRLDRFFSKLIEVRVLAATAPTNTLAIGNDVRTGGSGLIALPCPFVPSPGSPGSNFSGDVADNGVQFEGHWFPFRLVFFGSTTLGN